MTSHTFEIGADDFLLDGQPHRVISGALHYFRIHPDQWLDRIRMGRMMGLNTIETYVAWNEHAPTRGEFDTTGRLDLARFLREVQEEGMHAIVRPGPYICAEFDGGGFPAWLLRDPAVGVRTLEPRYMAAVSEYLRQVMEIVAPLQIDQGGPVIMLQVENEYGAYGSDHAYLRALSDLFLETGATVPLTTVDQPMADMLAAGNIPGLHATGSFGSRATERLAALRRQQPTGPLMCSEFWCGWFDHWCAHHHTTDPAVSARELDDLLAAGASVNIYMLHGGTNFGLTNGANDKGVWQPTITSYDYDAPLDEAGRPTEKFWAFREVISRYAPVPEYARPDRPPFTVPETAPLRSVGALSDVVAPDWQEHDEVPTMDTLGISRGLARYRVQLDRGPAAGVLAFSEVRDRAWVSLDGQPVGVLAREDHAWSITLPRGEGVLELLVEDQGRVNYGPRIGEPKGLIGPATFAGESLAGWNASAVPLEPFENGSSLLSSHGEAPLTAGAHVFEATVVLEEPADLALSTEGWGKGFVWVNGFCLGRYWRSGPQRTLFVPAPVTRAGENLVTVLEFDSLGTDTVRFVPDLDLGHTEY
ncbi:beta-galactosidase family protein [uncultured Microbacterium sp.]|uniref:glycoside hydrolase family 35 protein n=1 Tax=uncultured Microbacterium sp. TaxID=191216 RepID=UPI0026322D46|nr:beta-galactosidase family protein [uncultured Microbacterium sp.]